MTDVNKYLGKYKGVLHQREIWMDPEETPIVRLTEKVGKLEVGQLCYKVNVERKTDGMDWLVPWDEVQESYRDIVVIYNSQTDESRIFNYSSEMANEFDYVPVSRVDLDCQTSS